MNITEHGLHALISCCVVSMHIIVSLYLQCACQSVWWRAFSKAMWGNFVFQHCMRVDTSTYTAQTGLPATNLRAILQIFSAAGWHSWHGSAGRWDCPWEGSWMLAVHAGTHHQFWKLHTDFSWLWAGAGYIALTKIRPGQRQMVRKDCHLHYSDPVLPDCLWRLTLTTAIDSATSFLWLHYPLDLR